MKNGFSFVAASLFLLVMSLDTMAQVQAISLKEAYQQAAFKLFDKVADTEPENICFSPLSAQVVLSMVQNGAAGNTLSQMQDVLGTTGFSNDEVNLYNKQLIGSITYRPPFEYVPNPWWPEWTEEDAKKDYDKSYPICEVANGIWNREGTTFYDSFYDAMYTFYDAETGTVDFTSEEGISQINGWVNDKTHGLIPSILDEPLSSDMAMLLANVLYFKGSWSEPFEKEYTRPGIFHMADGSTVSTNMMNTISNFRSSTTSRFRTIRLNYGLTGEFTMTIFLPTDEKAFPSLTWEDWNTAFSQSTTNAFHLQMPTFYVDGKYDMNQMLIDLGMGDAFNPFNANFSNMYEKALWIDKVFQSSKISVDEEGTEAAAVTVVDMTDGANHFDEYEEFLVNRPFYFTIENRKEATVLFVGRVCRMNGTASISSIKTQRPATERVYDLQGRRLNTIPEKGIYIQNGKKRVR